MNKRYFVFALALLLACAQQTMAMYNPQTGRFLSRDPRAELGFQAMQRASGTIAADVTLPEPSEVRRIARENLSVPAVSSEGRIFERSDQMLPNADANPYHFVLNDPVNKIDPLGLKVRLSPWNGDAENHSSSASITIKGDWIEIEWRWGALKAIQYPWSTRQDRTDMPPSSDPWVFKARREMSGSYSLPAGHTMKGDHHLLTKIVDSDFLTGATVDVWEDKKCCKKATLPVKIGWNVLKVYDCPDPQKGIYYKK